MRNVLGDEADILFLGIFRFVVEGNRLQLVQQLQGFFHRKAGDVLLEGSGRGLGEIGRPQVAVHIQLVIVGWGFADPYIAAGVHGHRARYLNQLIINVILAD
ncbi:hypothetical protein D3C86_1768310 [compost metagenome]